MWCFIEVYCWLLGNCFRARRTGNGQNADWRQGVRGYDRASDPASELRDHHRPRQHRGDEERGEHHQAGNRGILQRVKRPAAIGEDLHGKNLWQHHVTTPVSHRRGCGKRYLSLKVGGSGGSRTKSRRCSLRLDLSIEGLRSTAPRASHAQKADPGAGKKH